MYLIKTDSSFNGEHISTRHHEYFYRSLTDARLAMVKESQTIFKTLIQGYMNDEYGVLPEYNSLGAGLNDIERQISLDTGTWNVQFNVRIYEGEPEYERDCPHFDM